MDITTQTTDVLTRVQRVVESLPFGEGMFAVRWTDTTTHSVQTGGKTKAKKATTAVSERLLTTAQMAEVLRGSDPCSKTHHVLMTPKAMDLLRAVPYITFIHILREGAPHKGDEFGFEPASAHEALDIKHLHTVAQKPFSSLTAQGQNDAIVARIDGGSHKVFTTNSTSLATLQSADYISGHFDNTRYDLDKAAVHLLTRDDITLKSSERRWGKKPHAPVANAREAIHLVPDYNRDSGRTRYIDFSWRPSQADWDRVNAHHAGKTGVFSSDVWEAVFVLDILGLRKAGAAMFEDFHAAKEEEDDDDL